MHNRIPPMFKVTLVAAAFTLSGCAATKEPSLIGEAIIGAGKVTADTGAKAVRGTKKLLGFGQNQDELQNDDVDLALLDNNQAYPADSANGAIIQPVQLNQAQRLDNTLQAPIDAPAIATTPAIDPNAIPVATIDHKHVVGPNETMWTIAKLTTGDANNWRILAEINQLDLNTPMKIGQEILIPADLVLPQFVAAATPAPAQINVIDEAPVLSDLPPLDLTAMANLDANSGEQLQDATDELMTEPLASVDTDVMAEPTLAASVDPTLNAIPLEADVGETLWDMAKRTTGDATNWKAIATHNGFTEKDIGRIRYGQTIYIPSDLAKAELGGDKLMVADAELPESDVNADAAATDNLVADATDEVAPATNAEAIDASASLVASASDDLMEEPKDIKIVEATFQTNENLAVDDITNSEPGQIIMVSGTYYPKAVYNEADFSSSLLMRVSPGTQMTVSKAMGPWYEVQTEFGVGYMHSRDIK